MNICRMCPNHRRFRNRSSVMHVTIKCDVPELFNSFSGPAQRQIHKTVPSFLLFWIESAIRTHSAHNMALLVFVRLVPSSRSGHVSCLSGSSGRQISRNHGTSQFHYTTYGCFVRCVPNLFQPHAQSMASAYRELWNHANLFREQS